MIQIPLYSSIPDKTIYFGYDFKVFEAYSDQITYSFVVFDNDRVNGFKRSESQFFNFKLPSFEDINKLNQLSYNQENLSKS